jgi:hypothetical protein
MWEHADGRGILDELREVQSDSEFARAHEIRNARVGRMLGIGSRRRRQQSCHHEQSAKAPFHKPPPFFRL